MPLGWLAPALIGLPAAALAASTEAEDQVQIQALKQQLRQPLCLPHRLALAPALRERLEAMVAAHLARMETLWPNWLRETAARLPSDVPAANRLAHLLQMNSLRLANTLALWQVASAGPAHDAAWQAALMQPRACIDWEPGQLLANRLRLLMRLPAEQLEVALRGEEALLARWGRTPARIDAVPADARAAPMAKLAALRRSGEREAGLRPMSPYLAERA